MGWVGAGCNVKSDEDALEFDMHRLLGFLEAAPPVADQDTLERLLDGRLDTASAPPDYRGLARLLTAAAAPAAPEELAGEQLAMATFAAELQSTPPILSPRRPAVPRKVFTMKAAAVALVAVLSIGGVAAAATGLLPGRAHHVADRAPATTAASTAGHGVGAAVADLDTARQGLCRAWQAGEGTDHGRRTDSEAFQALAAAAGGADNVAAYCKDVTTGGSGASGQGRASAVGPDATASARVGLCRAWQAGKGADQGQRANSVAFQALAAAAGGADKVAGYCKDVTAGAGTNGQGQAPRPSVSAPPSTVPPPNSGPPVSTGPPASTGPGGHGQGGPPTTTG
jgi:hypothetical protein